MTPVWKQRRAFLSPYVPLRHCCSLADLRPVHPITGYHLATTPPPPSTTSAGIFASAIRVGTQVQSDLWISHVPQARDDRTFSCLLHAGWSWGQHGLGGRSTRPPPYRFGPGVLATSTCSVLTTLTQVSFVSMGPGLVGEPRCGSQCRTFVRRLHTPVLAKHRRRLRSPYAVVLAYLLSEQSLTSLNGTPP